MIRYERLEKEILDMPKTWVIGIFWVLMKRVVEIPIFKPGQLLKTVEKLENDEEFRGRIK